MKWHLCSPLGVSERTTEADSEFWAKRRFVPIPKGWFVCSDASYQMGWTMPDAPEVCAKCFRNPPAPGMRKCETCRKRDKGTMERSNERKRAGIRGKNAKSGTRAKSLRQFYESETPEQKEARKAKLSRIALDTRSREAKERVRQQNIRDGITRRAAKRAAQLSLFGA